MRIVLTIAKNPFFENSASANRWRTLIEGLVAKGVDIELLISNGYATKEEYRLLGTKGKYLNVKYHYLTVRFNHSLWLRRLNKYILTPLYNSILLAKVTKVIRKSDATIVWTSADLFGMRIADALKKSKTNKKLFLEMSEFLDIHRYNAGNAVQKKQGDIREHFFNNVALYAYDGIALMTKTLIKYFESLPGTLPKLLHLPMTVDLDRFCRPLPTLDGFDRPYIAFVGVMDNKKDGVDILLKAFETIKDFFPELKLVLVGSWNYDTPSHLDFIREKGLQNRVFWKGEYQRDQIPNIIQNAELLVLPRPDSKQAQGGFPTKLGEYLATGNPVCATRVGEIPDYLKDDETVYFAEPGSVKSFANAMNRALNNSTEAKLVGKNGRRAAEQYFNKDIQTDKLYEFLKAL